MYSHIVEPMNKGGAPTGGRCRLAICFFGVGPFEGLADLR